MSTPDGILSKDQFCTIMGIEGRFPDTCVATTGAFGIRQGDYIYNSVTGYPMHTEELDACVQQGRFYQFQRQANTIPTIPLGGAGLFVRTNHSLARFFYQNNDTWRYSAIDFGDSIYGIVWFRNEDALDVYVRPIAHAIYKHLLKHVDKYPIYQHPCTEFQELLSAALTVAPRNPYLRSLTVWGRGPEYEQFFRYLIKNKRDLGIYDRLCAQYSQENPHGK